MKLLFLALLISFSTIGFSQSIDKPEAQVNKSTVDLKQTDDVQYLRNCLGKYYKVRQSARVFSFVSIASAGYSLTLNDEDKRNQVLYVSGASALIAIIGNISAEKWLKRASLKPADSGLGVKFEF
mgnify:CR=1 FL=1